MHELTAIYWIKNETKHLPEYIEFHLMQGFDHFIFYDNGSVDGLLDVVKPYGDLVEIRYYPPTVTGPKNFWVAGECCREQRGKSKWIHFHSVDERIYCPDGRKIPEFLQEFEQYGGVLVAWEEFNSNGHEIRPRGLVIENYTQTFVDLGKHYKTITRPDVSIEFAGNPHGFRYIQGYYSVDENHRNLSIENNVSEYTYNRIKNHHYRTMSLEEFETKSNKGVLDHGMKYENSRRPVAQEEWDYAHGLPSPWGQSTLGENTQLLKFVEPVREAIHERFKGNEHLLALVNH